MVSIRLPAVAAGTAVILALSSAAYAAPLPTQDACAVALAAAERAESDYDALMKDLRDRIAQGGNPDASELQALADAEAQRNAIASQAQRICGP
ncbi:hypothetical protein ABZ070_11435 [Streptomyces sp. NPDC006283]|uniref:hypothetical protein n=1 Tax=Streptomyces sp. NPDC006283 TaxID=3156741 RepID=UPI0033AE70EB